jgi:DNA-directed RNA polymerase specialized sigma24 family protein
MIAIASRPKRTVHNPHWHRRFLEMLPAIRRDALFCFRNLSAEAREELVQETIANCYVACCRLAQRRRLAAAHPSPLVRYAVSQVRSGRRIGCRLNSHDVLSEYAQRRKGFQVEWLDHDDEHGEWHATLVEDHHTPVDDQAAFRIDFPAWLTRLAPRQRRMVKFLAAGNSTSDAARRFRLSLPRISQLRRELHRDWMQFHGGRDAPPPLSFRRLTSTVLSGHR